MRATEECLNGTQDNWQVVVAMGGFAAFAVPSDINVVT